MPSIVDTPFELEAELVLRCSVFVGPLRKGHAELHYLDKHADKFQSSLVFPATNLIGYEDKKPIRDMFYQITFFNDCLGGNPDWTYSSFAKVS